MNSLNIFCLIFLVLSWGGIIWLLYFCYSRIFREDKDKIVGPLEVEAEIDEHSH